MKKWWAKTLLLLGFLAALFLLALAASNYRGKSAIEAYRDELRTAGEKLDLEELIPPRPDPASNSIQLFREVIQAMGPELPGVLSSNPPPVMRMIKPGKAMVGWQQPDIWDGDKAVNTWADIESALETHEYALGLLRQIPERPLLDFELEYRQGFKLSLPHLSSLKHSAQFLSAAVMVDLHRGEIKSAVTGVHTMLKIVSVWDEPLLLSQLVRIIVAQIAFNSQWDLLQSTNLTDAELAMLQSDLTHLEFIQPMEKALLIARAYASTTIQQLRTSNSPSISFWGAYGPSAGGGSSGNWWEDFLELGESAKRGTSDSLWRISWSYADELNVLKGNQLLIDALRQIQSDGFFSDAMAERERKWKHLGLDSVGKNWLRDKLDDGLQALRSEELHFALDRVLRIEASKSLAITAIALKRYHLINGSYPVELSLLAPGFLLEIPRDPVDGQPLRYKLKEDGTFLLYSIGKDGKDDGGDAASSSRLSAWSRGRDWVWPQPATAEEIEEYWEEISSR